VNYLLDTNVVSEWAKPQPHEGVVEWLLDADEDRLFLSVLSIAEIRRGVELLPESSRRERLFEWLLSDLSLRFEGRILTVSPDVAHQWGISMAMAQKSGVALSPMDGFFAATALVHDLTLVTRNLQDFQRVGITLLNPWELE